MWNALKSNESQKIWLLQVLKIEILKGEVNNSAVLWDWYPQETRMFYLIRGKF